MIIAGAGGAAHLPGMCAAWTALPVLGVPVESHALKGMDSLLSIVQMPAGIPVGTLAIGRAGAINAALLAAAILAWRRAGTVRPDWMLGPRGADRRRRTRQRAAGPGVSAQATFASATFPLAPNATIGLVGGGQLGRMSAMAAARLGYRCHILTREHGQSGAPGLAGVTISDYSDPVTLRAFAAAVDVISFEFENVSAEGLDLLASLKPVRPSPAVLRISQDRVAEKRFLNAAGVATAPWRPVADLAELTAAVARFGLPAVLKTTRQGYDGKGQARAAHAGGPGARRLSGWRRSR